MRLVRKVVRAIRAIGRSLLKRSYSARRRSELAAYTAIQDVRELPQIAHYWSEKYLIPRLVPFGYRNSIECFRSYIGRMCSQRAPSTVFILSVGAGDSASEINIAEWLRENSISNYRFECLDLNPEVLSRGRASAKEKGLSEYFSFGRFDVNSWKPKRSYDIVLAFQSLHHFVELELLFDKIHRNLRDDGYFMADDMIGRNGHQRWPEALTLVEDFWRELPDKYKFNHGLQCMEKDFVNRDYSTEGFEGIRAQDILPLLVERFSFELFVAFGNVIDIFIDRCFGHNFDASSETDQAFIDRVHAVDEVEIESGRVKPTHMMAVMTKMPVAEPKIHKHLSPQFCIRRP